MKNLTLKRAKEIVYGTEEVSIEEYLAAVKYLEGKEKKKNISKSNASRRAYLEWLKLNKETTDLRDETRKFWPPETT